VRGPGGGGGTFPPAGGGGIALPLPEVGRDGAVGGGVAAVRAAGRSSAEGVVRDAGATAGAADAAAAGRSIGAGASGGIGAGEERTTRCADRTTAGFASSATTGATTWGTTGSPAAGAAGATGAMTAGTSGSGGAGVGSGSTTGSRFKPRASARRRTRSADGSSMLDEWLFTPILSSLESSTTTALSTPSSRASS